MSLQRLTQSANVKSDVTPHYSALQTIRLAPEALPKPSQTPFHPDTTLVSISSSILSSTLVFSSTTFSAARTKALSLSLVKVAMGPNGYFLAGGMTLRTIGATCKNPAKRGLSAQPGVVTKSG